MLDFFRRSLVSTIYESYRRSADRLHSTRERNPLQELRDVIDVIHHCISLCLVTRKGNRTSLILATLCFMVTAESPQRAHQEEHVSEPWSHHRSRDCVPFCSGILYERCAWHMLALNRMYVHIRGPSIQQMHGVSSVAEEETF